MEETLRNNIKIVEHYGYEKQIPVWIEEMSELTKELCKWSRKGNLHPELIDNIKEEIADVTICLDQLKYILHYIEDDLMAEYKYKVDRQLNRIANENIDMIRQENLTKTEMKVELKGNDWLSNGDK